MNRAQQRSQVGERGDSFSHHAQGPAAQMYRFVADPPTTTMQRLRGILTVR
jgi:predicted AlkP superfamily pyrophosphatase or phosphodiesterase